MEHNYPQIIVIIIMAITHFSFSVIHPILGKDADGRFGSFLIVSIVTGLLVLVLGLGGFWTVLTG